MREEKFAVAGTPRVFFRLPLGSARIVAGDSGEVVVTLDGRDSTISRFVVEVRGDEVVVEPERTSAIRWSAVDLTIRIGRPGEIRARLTSADLNVDMPVETLQVDSASGDITAADVAGSATIHSASGDIRVGQVGGRLDVAAASGDIRIASAAGGGSVKSASGDVRLGVASGETIVKSASGDVTVTSFDGSWLDVKSLSGDVTVGVVPGRRLEVSFQTLSGDVRTDFPVSSGADGGSGRLTLKTVSGDIVVQGASA
jgi:DUF4097 and DUF4098 domain-containing protein YvlB